MLPLFIVVAAPLAKIICLKIFHDHEPISFSISVGILGCLVAAIVARQSNIYSVSSIIEGRKSVLTILMIVSIAVLTVFGLFYFMSMSDQLLQAWFPLWFGLSFMLLAGTRLGILYRARQLLAEDRLLQKVAIYGTAPLASQVMKRLAATPRDHTVVGMFSDDDRCSDSASVAGGMSALVASVRSGGCDRVVLALPANDRIGIDCAISSLSPLPIDIQLSPDAMVVPSRDGSRSTTSDLVLLDVQRRPLSARDTLIKTVMDYALGTVALLLLAPVMALIAVAIKLDSRGPIFFVQSRHGYNHRIIRVVKFRTMTVLEDGPTIKQAVKGDKRITRVGRILRSTSFDEFPQLFNVLSGELSLVGPRPHAIAHNDYYSQVVEDYAKRHKVKPGITGWAQVNGFRGETKTAEDMRKRIEHDLYYIKNWSLWLDIKIIAKTALVPFHSPNAY